MEDGFGLGVVMLVDYAAGLLSYKERKYFLGALVLEGDCQGRGPGLNAMKGKVKLCDKYCCRLCGRLCSGFVASYLSNMIE